MVSQVSCKRVRETLTAVAEASSGRMKVLRGSGARRATQVAQHAAPVNGSPATSGRASLSMDGEFVAYARRRVTAAASIRFQPR
ncbi:unnamed protein product, partial [Iphiclides podalirius]